MKPGEFVSGTGEEVLKKFLERATEEARTQEARSAEENAGAEN